MPFKFDSEVIDQTALVVTFPATMPLKCENYREKDKVFNCSGFDSMCKINSPADFVNLAPRCPPVMSKTKAPVLPGLKTFQKTRLISVFVIAVAVIKVTGWLVFFWFGFHYLDGSAFNTCFV